ncbi:MAG: NAD(P)/FAD-dependent oxidoreductase [Acidimicrobiia bacterium]|nr:NAD(P)/FAD-dependent oxidoreductase [Acidimicrobiia bacterium]
MPANFEVVIVGAGPAGLAAASAAVERSRRVLLIDDNPAPGGQIWRGEGRQPPRGVETWLETQVLGPLRPGLLMADRAGVPAQISYEKLILATGARERFLPFPGWTLPSVMGAGGLQALVKGGLAIEGKRVVVAGTGPLLLAVAAYLAKRNARILLVAEQAPRQRVLRFTANLWRQPAKLAQAFSMGRYLALKYRTGLWPVSAHGNGKLEEILLSNSRRLACDYLSCGFGLVPNSELAALLGCRIATGEVLVDEFQRTTRERIWCAGEPTGIGGAELSIIEGRIAGYAATGDRHSATSLFTARMRASRFPREMDSAFSLRPELRRLVHPGTIICRCEDVRFSQLTSHTTWRAMKLHTRCGMGPCQGRVCGPAVEFLLGCAPEGARPPLYPATVSQLALDRQ